MTSRLCWCPISVLRDLNSFVMQKLSFVFCFIKQIWPLVKRIFETRTATGIKRTFRKLGPYLSPRFLYYSCLMEKRYLVMRMCLCEGKLKVKIAHFRLPSPSQKRACLSSLMKRRRRRRGQRRTSIKKWTCIQQKTQNVVISRCCLAENDKEMYQEL